MYGDQFFHMTQSLLPVAIVLRMCFGLWLLANVDKTEELSLVDRVTVRRRCCRRRRRRRRRRRCC
eukprot:COSAG05_NODE_3470_length_2040_cov_2.140134_1_plen_64_part_10